MLVAGQGVDNLDEEWVSCDGTHHVVGDTCGDCLSDKGRHSQKRVQLTLTPVVQVDVDTTIVQESKVADGVGSLDGVRIRVPGGDEPRVLFSYELTGHFVGPQDVLVLGVQVDTGSLAWFPYVWDFFGFEGLVDDLGDDLGSF